MQTLKEVIHCNKAIDRIGKIQSISKELYNIEYQEKDYKKLELTFPHCLAVRKEELKKDLRKLIGNKITYEISRRMTRNDRM